MRVSIIVPVGRNLDTARACVEGVLAQETTAPVELVLVGGEELSEMGPSVRVVRVDEMNPAVRRNRGVEHSSGELIGFVDDDAVPAPGWISNALDVFGDEAVAVVGGPDPAPADSGIAELITDTLLAAPLFGSGVLAHGPPRGERRDVTSPSDLALVNLFIRRDCFERLGGFDESIGYVGEDSDLIARASACGRVVYDPEVIVWHRRRPFPSGYVRQRFRYRVKTGRMLTRPESLYRRNAKVVAFLTAGFLFGVTAVFAPAAGIVLAALYVVGSLMSGATVTKLPWYWWPLLPLFFAVHHATYLVGLLTGIFRGILERATEQGGRQKQENQ